MLNLFGKNKGQESNALPEWTTEMQEIEQRWKGFLQKMEQRLHELGEASIPELQEAFKEDQANDSNNYHKMCAGVIGQIRGMDSKANEVYDDKIIGFYTNLMMIHSTASNPGREMLDDFRSSNHDLLNAFEAKCNEWIDKAQATEVENPEEKYRNILNTYETIKDKFKCSQCGGKIKIDRIYFINTYIKCEHCQTQNTFDPGTIIKELEWVTRTLAEARTQHLLDAYDEANAIINDLHDQIHSTKMDAAFEESKSKKTALEGKIVALKEQRKKRLGEAPLLYQKYLRAMFDEWHVLMPDMKEQNERVYEGMLASAKRGF
jgi:RNA polymerase-binding transcription factor DksA